MASTSIRRQWFERHPRFTFHLVPTACSRPNAVDSRGSPKRGLLRSVVDQQKAINRFVVEFNQQPKPLRLDRRSREDHHSRQRYIMSQFQIQAPPLRLQ
jgi:hypothetical protein